MSDYPQGPGWWQASDGKWYPPQEPTAVQPQQTSPYPPYQAPGTPPPPAPKSKGPLIAVLAVVAVIAVAIVGFVVVSGGDDDEQADDPPVATEPEGEETTTTADDGGDPGDAPEGFVVFASPEEGFTILLPDEWREFDLADPAVQQQLDDFIGENPRMGRALSSAQDIIDAGGVLLAIDPVRTPFGPNINMIKSPGETNLEFLESTVANQLEPIGATNITTDIVEVPAGEALAIEYDLPLNLPEGGSIDVHGMQFQLPAAGSTWAITMTTDDIDRDRAQFEQMIDSFTVEG